MIFNNRSKLRFDIQKQREGSTIRPIIRSRFEFPGHTPKCSIPAIGYVWRLSCDEKQRNLQRSELSEALRVDTLGKW